MKKKRWARWIKILVLVYAVTGIAFYYLQDMILFHPTAYQRNHRYQFSDPHREINIPYDANSNINIIQFITADSVPKGLVLYFHGNRKNISWYARYASNFTRRGYEIWMIDYPGYGKSTGKLTEDRLYLYAMQMYRLARTRFKPQDILIYGKSMGTGIAAQLAAVRDCRYLILETPYYSMTSLVSHYFPIYPVSRMLHYRLPTHEYLQKVTAPVVIFHGTDDGVIPYRNAARLKDLLKPGDEFITLEGGHHNDLNDFASFHRSLDSLLSQ